MSTRTRRAFAEVDALLDEAVGAVFPGASVAVWSEGRPVFERAIGRLHPAHRTPVSIHSRFDVASLTKPMCVATLCALGVAEGWWSLDEAVGDLGPEWDASPAVDATYGQLLGHSSGLPGWRPLYEALQRAPAVPWGSHGAASRIREAVLTEPLEAPPGARVEYSDLGYLALGYALRHRLSQQLGVAFQERVAGLWGLDQTGYAPPPPDAAPATEICAVRGRCIRGEVHDENASASGEPCGHAGLFASAPDVAAWAEFWRLSALSRGPLPAEVVHAFWTTSAAPAADSSWRLGFDTPSSSGSSAGALVSPEAVGHLGFTGCSVWIEPARSAVVVLLSNRAHPSRANDAIRQFRPRLHDAVWQALDRR